MLKVKNSPKNAGSLYSQGRPKLKEAIIQGSYHHPFGNPAIKGTVYGTDNKNTVAGGPRGSTCSTPLTTGGDAEWQFHGASLRHGR